MKKDIILAGVGGQGILSIAASIGFAAIEMGLHIKQAEVHGMSQRGGDVHSNLRLSDKPIYSDLIPAGGADLILSVEPMESLRYLPLLSDEGWVVTNINPYKNIPDYPDIEGVLNEIRALPKHLLLDANKTAKDLGSGRSANMVILGAAAPFLDIEYKYLENGVRKLFGNKGKDVVELNLKALEKGNEIAMDYLKK